MPEYIFSAQSKDGGPITDRVTAPSMSAAKSKIEADGLQNIRFLTDDFNAALSKALMTPEEEDDFRLSAEEEVACGRSSWLGSIWLALRGHAFLWIPLWIWNLVTLFGGKPYGGGDWTGFCLTALFILYFAGLIIPSVAYNSLIRAATWNKLSETRFLVWFLKVYRFGAGRYIPKMDLEMRLAGVLARKGKTKEALAIVKWYEANHGNDPMVRGRIGGVYHSMGEHERGIQFQAAAAEAANNRTLEVLDHAHSLVRYMRDARQSEEVLKRVENDEMSELVRAFVLFTKGLIALERKEFKTANDFLVEAMGVTLLVTSKDAGEAMVNEMCAYRSIVLASMGERKEAMELFKMTRKWLRAANEKPLLSWCEEALGVRRS